MPCHPRSRTRAGFTLVELVVVVLVLGILAAVAAPRFVNTASSAKSNATRSSLSVVRDALEAYRGENGGYPQAEGLAASLRAHLKGPFPTAQIGNVNASVVASTQNPIKTPEAGGAGWAYNPSTGDFVVNHADGIGW